MRERARIRVLNKNHQYTLLYLNCDEWTERFTVSCVVVAGYNDDLIYCSREVYVMLRSSHRRSVLTRDCTYLLSAYVSMISVHYWWLFSSSGRFVWILRNTVVCIVQLWNLTDPRSRYLIFYLWRHVENIFYQMPAKMILISYTVGCTEYGVCLLYLSPNTKYRKFCTKKIKKSNKNHEHFGISI